jgi:hypothetical protein
MSDAFDRAVNKEFVEEQRLGWRIHLFVYVAVNALLVATWWFTSDGGEVMPWFIFSLIGWGIGLGAHYMAYRSKRSTLPPV